MREEVMAAWSKSGRPSESGRASLRHRSARAALSASAARWQPV
ncbi:hypothetical protein [Nonomuraea rubra]